MTLSVFRFLIAHGVTVSAIVAASASLQTAHAADFCPGQDVATHQGVVGFNSLTDGQPGTPGLPQLTVIPSYDFDAKAFQNQLSISGVVASSGFWCQAQFELFVPTLDAVKGKTDLEKSISASWQQRWLIDDGSSPTLSTVVAVELPYEHEAHTGVSLTGIIARSTQWGALYLNLLAESTDADNFNTVDFFGVIGVKRIQHEQLALITDIAVYEGGTYALEVSAQLDYNNGLSLGPGVTLSRAGDGSGNIDVIIGIVIFKVFGG